MLQALDLKKLNSVTKYPSIPTYHVMGKMGRLTDELTVSFGGRHGPEELVATEKVDGANARVVRMPDASYLIGSREEWLYSKGDLIFNPDYGIVDLLRGVANIRINHAPYWSTSLSSRTNDTTNDPIEVYYFEVFGGRTGRNAKQYTSDRLYGYRLFDVVHLPLDKFGEVMDMAPEQISGWRERGGQPFLNEEQLQAVAARFELELTPRIPIDSVPANHQEVMDWLKEKLPETQCRLDAEAGGKPEGVVVRTLDRRKIVKIKYRDYELICKKGWSE